MSDRRAIFAFSSVVAVLALAALVALLRGCLAPEPVPIAPLPRFGLPHNASAALVGESLFENPWIGRSSLRRCGACHVYSMGGVDNRRHSLKPLEGAFTRSVVNAAFAPRYYGSGSATNLEEVVIEMVSSKKFADGGSPADAASRVIRFDEPLAKRFEAVYGRAIDADAVVDSLVSYLMGLVGECTLFDDFLRGQTNALNAVEIKGYGVFMESGCIKCHGGANMGARAGGDIPRRESNPRGLRGLFKRGEAYRRYENMPGAPKSLSSRADLEAFLKIL